MLPGALALPRVLTALLLCSGLPESHGSGLGSPPFLVSSSYFFFTQQLGGVGNDSPQSI